MNNIFFFYITPYVIYKKSISKAILDHLEAWILKIANRANRVGPPGDTEL